jgi:hypothetical protein
MKQKLKKIYQSLIICTIIVLNSCQKEDEMQKSNEQQSIFGTVNLNQIPEIKNAIDKKKNKSTSRQNASVYLNLINPENIITVIDEFGYKSYTFSLNFEEENQLSNLVMQETKSGLVYYLAKYTTNNFAQWKNDLDNKILSNTDVNVTFEDLDAPNTGSSRYDCQKSGMKRVCPSGQHSWGQQAICDYYYKQWIYQVVITNVDCDIISGSSTTSPNGGHGGTGGLYAEKEPCDNMKRKTDPTKANIKPAVTALKNILRNNLNPSGENGYSLSRSFAGVYDPPQQLASTSTNKIPILVGSTYYASIHTHPSFTIVPMFSFEDVYSLLQLYQNTPNINNNEVTIILVGETSAGIFDTYSLNIADFDMFYDAVIAKLNNASGSTIEKKIMTIDVDLANKYGENSNKEKTFLSEFEAFGITLFKANSDLSKWGQLIIPNPEIATSKVKSIPCPN